jgi:predicted acyltransferase
MPEVVAPNAAPAPASGVRLVSLDAFRGLTILGMLLVNNVSLDTATPTHLTHAGWGEGVHFADLVFPWFLLIVGVALPFSAGSHRRRGGTRLSYVAKALARATALVLLGCLIDSSLAKTPVFGLGVLQLIGLAYLVGALLYPLPAPLRLVVALGLLVGHWAALRFIAPPGAVAGAVTEATNIVSYVNDAYLSPIHLRGLISVAPTAALVMLGALVGDLLRLERATQRAKAALLPACGLAMAVLGWLWSRDLPFSKALWTASYILYSGGVGVVVLSGFYLAADVLGWRALVWPLVVPGANALAAYVGPILVKVHVLQEWTWAASGAGRVPLQQALLGSCVNRWGAEGGGWVYTLGYLAVCWLALLVLHRKGLYLRV